MITDFINRRRQKKRIAVSISSEYEQQQSRNYMQYSFAMNDMLHIVDGEKWSVSDQIDLLEFGLKILKRDLIYDRLCEAYFSVSENNNRDFRKELGKFVRDYETADGTINPAKPEQKRMVLVRLNDVYTDPWQRKKVTKSYPSYSS